MSKYIEVKNTDFKNLSNSSALLFYVESFRNAHKQSLLTFSNCTINDNEGNEFTSMFLIEIRSHNENFDDINNEVLGSVRSKAPSWCMNRIAIFISFEHCDFINNANMNSLINILLKQNEQVVVLLTKSKICFNSELQFINTNNELKLVKSSSFTITINSTIFLSNSCKAKDRINLLTITSGIIKLNNSVIANNSNFEAIVHLHSSVLQYEGVTKNYVRRILRGTEGSYYVYTEFLKVIIIKNFLYSVSTTSKSYTKNSKEICEDQFITNQKNNLDFKFRDGAKLNFTIALINNTYTIPKYEINLLQNETHHETCIWLADTAFKMTESTKIFNTVFSVKRIFANKVDIGKIPSSVCPCSSTDDYNCNEHEIDLIFSGQKLTIKLLMPKEQ